MSISIFDRDRGYDTYDEYDVTFFDDRILTTVTATPSVVNTWIWETERIHRRRLHNLVVALEAEWSPNFRRGRNDNPIATLQLCVGRRCLIFQILHAPYIPNPLEDFLSDADYTFVGVGVKNDAEKLDENYDLSVANTVDLRDLAAEKLSMEELRNKGLKGLAWEVLDLDVEKPINVTLSRWDNRWLSEDQIQYACVDAFVSFEIGRTLNAGAYRY
ncbi:hypothetical protein Ddye_011897 [Dipteronia dyeriana]|uniref:3'-5' exonuclease domain-containing protein n=1 Tax=Dipteronia dyeriana TaxID=168575 RepID=A0AAD9X3D2_9ROSI|nr:hypothetical protein Ddye_011897 [Dipteronia dyeriana]